MKTFKQLQERLGGKGYKPYTSLTGKKVSGDWEDSDRGAGNKAKKRAGGKVEKKSPTYLAHVHNKEESNWRADFYQESATNPKKFDMEKFKQGLRDREGAVFHGDPGTEPKKQPKPKAKPQKPLSDAERNRREVIARYGGESNYKAGRGLGT